MLVVDELGGAAAPSVAELLAGRGCRVELQTSALAVAQDLATTLELPRWRARAAQLGIRLTPEQLVERVTGGARLTISLLHHPTGTGRTAVADWIVVAAHAEPADELWRELRASGIELHRIGDCRAPRRADAAVREGERVGALL